MVVDDERSNLLFGSVTMNCVQNIWLQNMHNVENLSNESHREKKTIVLEFLPLANTKIHLVRTTPRPFLQSNSFPLTARWYYCSNLGPPPAQLGSERHGECHGFHSNRVPVQFPPASRRWTSPAR
jgi:hypothetical protein